MAKDRTPDTMPPLTATPTNTLPGITRGSLLGRGECRRCMLLRAGDGLTLLCEGDAETDTGEVGRPPAKEALGRSLELI